MKRQWWFWGLLVFAVLIVGIGVSMLTTQPKPVAVSSPTILATPIPTPKTTYTLPPVTATLPTVRPALPPSPEELGMRLDALRERVGYLEQQQHEQDREWQNQLDQLDMEGLQKRVSSLEQENELLLRHIQNLYQVTIQRPW